MNNARIVVLAIAIGAGGIAAYLASGFGDKKVEVAMVDEFELTSFVLKDFTVKSLGTNSALVTYTAHYESKAGGQTQKADSIFGEVWVHQGNDWKALYIQETYLK